MSEHGRSFETTRRWFAAAVGVLVLTAACERPPPPGAPSASQVEALYEYGGPLAVEMSGNVAQITVEIDQDEYRMGGRVWAMASPYIFLFSPATERAFIDYPGLGGARVIVRYPDGSLLAQALLEPGELSYITWPQALNVAARARTEGTESPGFMRDLVRYGEEHTEFEYNERYTRR